MDLSKRIPASEALCSCIKLNKVKSCVYLAVPKVLEEHPRIYSIGLKMYFPLYLFPCPYGGLERYIDNSDLCSLNTLFIHKFLLDA